MRTLGDTTFSVKVTGKCSSDSVGVARVKVYKTQTVSPTGKDTTYCKDMLAKTCLQLH